MSQEETDSVDVVLRTGKEADHPFIYATWRNSLWYDNPRPASEAENFFKQTSRRIRKLVNNPENHIQVAVLKDDPNLILGYAITSMEDGINLEWVYVKADYRKKGIGGLVAGHFNTISQPETKIGCAIALNKKISIRK